MVPVNLRPESIGAEMATFGKKLGAGLEHFMDAGEIESGVSNKTAVYEEDKLVLYRYEQPEGVERTNETPMLIVYALVNRPYMTDIQEDRSTVKSLLNAGQDVYLIDWGYPDAADRCLTMDDYINGYIDRCVDHICEEHGIDKVNVLGICQGGAFSLCYTALHSDRVKNLVTMVTPVDFQTPDNILSKWVQNVDVDLLVDTMGNIPGGMLNSTFLALKPFSLYGQKYVSMIDTLDNPRALKNFLRMEKWIFDSPDQAGETFRQFIKDFYQENKLMRGEVEIGGEIVDLRNIKLPVLNVYALKDHLVPPDASRALKACVGSKDYTEMQFKGGHIGIYVSGKAQKEIPAAIGKWLDERD